MNGKMFPLLSHKFPRSAPIHQINQHDRFLEAQKQANRAKLDSPHRLDGKFLRLSADHRSLGPLHHDPENELSLFSLAANSSWRSIVCRKAAWRDQITMLRRSN